MSSELGLEQVRFPSGSSDVVAIVLNLQLELAGDDNKAIGQYNLLIDLQDCI